MRLDSVRGLKEELLGTQLKTLGASPMRAARLAVAARAVSALHDTPRTVALGISRKGRRDYTLAVRVQNLALLDAPEVELARRRARGEADVRYVGRIVKRVAPWYRRRQRPLLIGASVAHEKVTAGSIGAFVRTREGELRLLSNNHVLANENDAASGDRIIQPGRLDGGSKSKSAIGTLDRFIPLKPRGANLLDAALATLDDGVRWNGTKLRYGRGLPTRLCGVAPHPADEGDIVIKVGRTTGVTRGRVTAFELDNVIVGYDIGNLRFDDQIEIEGADEGPFCLGGDSGSLVVDPDGLAVALLFAGGDAGGTNGMGLTYATPIGVVLGKLGVELAV